MIAAVKSRPRKRLVVAYAEDAHTLEAVNAAVQMGIVEATLVGNRAEIARQCMALEIDPHAFKIAEEDGDVPYVNKAVRMINDGEGDILMKGLVSTDKYMRGILNKELRYQIVTAAFFRTLFLMVCFSVSCVGFHNNK